MREVFDFAIQLAEQAGANTLKYFQQSLEIISKPDDSPVTVADRSTEELLRAEIESHYPEDAILGEEYGEKSGTSGYRWVLDPIDGTKSFIRGVPLYGTLIALEKEDTSIFGIMRFPPLNETVAALRGQGSFFNGIRCRVSEIPTLSSAAVMMTEMNTFIRTWGQETFFNLVHQTAFQRTWGDCYAYRLVATGKADAMIDTEVKRWDVAALIPIIEEAGGSISSLDGVTSNAITNCVASNGKFHQDLLNMLVQGNTRVV
ncbi:MAG: histidinol-phosphatase [bacterium]|jgi:histidinol-phosphatase